MTSTQQSDDAPEPFAADPVPDAKAVADGGEDGRNDLDLEAAEDGRGAAEPGVVGGI
jgi:hypothetical protein